MTEFFQGAFGVMISIVTGAISSLLARRIDRLMEERRKGEKSSDLDG